MDNFVGIFVPPIKNMENRMNYIEEFKRQLIQNYDAEKKESSIFLPSGFALHACVQPLIDQWYIKPASAEWAWSTGWVTFPVPRFGRFMLGIKGWWR